MTRLLRESSAGQWHTVRRVFRKMTSSTFSSKFSDSKTGLTNSWLTNTTTTFLHNTIISFETPLLRKITSRKRFSPKVPSFVCQHKEKRRTKVTYSSTVWLQNTSISSSCGLSSLAESLAAAGLFEGRVGRRLFCGGRARSLTKCFRSELFVSMSVKSGMKHQSTSNKRVKNTSLVTVCLHFN